MKKHHKLAARKRIQAAIPSCRMQFAPAENINLTEKPVRQEKEFANEY